MSPRLHAQLVRGDLQLMPGLVDANSVETRQPRWTRMRVRQYTRMGGVFAGRATPATVGLALILVALTGVCTWAARDADSSSTTAGRQLRIAAAHESVLRAVYAEHTAQIHYLDSPHARSPRQYARQQRIAHAAARQQLESATDAVQEFGDESDRVLASYVLMVERRNNTTVEQLFAAVDAGRLDEAMRLERDVVGPAVESLLGLVATAAERHRSSAAAGIARLKARSDRSATLIPAVFGLAFVFLGGCWALLLTLQQDLKRQAGALVREKALVDGVISASPTLVYWKDADGRYQGGNQAFLKLRAVENGEDMLGKTDQELPIDGMTRSLIGIEREVRERGAAVMHRQVIVQDPQGPAQQLLLSVIPRLGPSDSVDGVIGAGADVTRVAELERQLSQASRLESIGQLAAGMAHEINTPIQYISHNTRFIQQSLTDIMAGLLQLSELSRQHDVTPEALRDALTPLDLDFLREELPDALNESLEGLQRVAELVLAMKDFSDPGSGRTETDVNRALQNAVHLSRGEWQGVADVEFHFDEDVGLIPCYEGELEQAFLNIVLNAAQAIGEDRRLRSRAALGRIVVSTTRRNNCVIISIRDDGPGMGEEVRRRIFDPFFTTKAVGQGTGQGLALANATVVQKHGGTMDVESTPGEGTVFTITLPDQQQPETTQKLVAATGLPAQEGP